jgi:2-amino-4-hydroxy-6-hydroxymethyldihydropteridine diphosphokinase
MKSEVRNPKSEVEQLAIVALGSNLGDSRRNVLRAMERLRELSEHPLLKSSLWQTAPEDCPAGSPAFVNAVVAFVPRRGATPESVLATLQEIEKEFGRKPKKVLNEPRPLDLDLIAFGKKTRAGKELTLPHPRTHQRRFVLQPLSEIAPDLILPARKETVLQLLGELPPAAALTPKKLPVRSGRSSRAAALCVALWWGIFLGSDAYGRADGSAGPGSPASAIVAHLRYREVDFAPLCREINVTRGARFTREPAFVGPRVFRGRFVLDDVSNQSLPFAWDVRERKLYLDLNHNGDLTDDPAGVLTASDGDLQLFRGLRLRFGSEAGPYDVLVDAHVFEQGDTARVFLYVRSLWEGAVGLGGKRWYLAVIDRPNGRIGPTASMSKVGARMILRRWADHDQPCLWWHASLRHVHDLSHVKLVDFPFRYAGNAEVFDAFNVPANLFLEGQAYRIEYHVESGGNLAVAFRAFQPPRGKLHLGGEYLRRVVLDGGSAGFTAVLDSPLAELEVPAGVYPRQIVLLQRAGFTNIAAGLGTNLLTITETNLAALNVGGPLQNAVRISPDPSSGTVSLNYQLINVAGISFRLAYQDEKAPPRLEIRQGDRQVAQGRFRFG